MPTVYQAMPPEWSKEPTKDAPSGGGLTPGKVVDILKKNAGEAASRTLGLATGTRDPEGITEFAVQTAAQAPALGLAGKAATTLLPAVKAAPAVARSLVAGGQAAGRAASEGREGAVWEGALGVTGAALAESVLGLSGKALTRAADAFDKIIQRTTGPSANATLSPTMFRRIMEYWKADKSKAVQDVRAKEIEDVLKFADPSGESSALFREEIAKGTKMLHDKVRVPAIPERPSRALREGMPAAKSIADAAMSHATPAALSLDALAKAIPGAKHLLPRWARGSDHHDD